MAVTIAGNILVQSNGEALPISMGGTGQSTAPTALNALLPVQTGQNGKVLITDGTNVSWSSSAGVSAAGSDTQIQYNDAGNFGASSNFVINKSTGALTSLSTFSGTGLFISNADATTRALKFQTAGSDRWLMQANNVSETGSNVGSNFEFVRVADNGATSNQVFTVARLSGIVDFKATPTINGVAIGGVSSFNTRTGAVTLTSGDVTTALTFTPYNSTNPAGYTSNIGTVTSVAGTGTVSGLTLTGTVTTSGSLTLGGTLSLTSGQVTTALGFTPGAGTVTSVAGTGTVSGLTLTGTITSSGSLTLGGTLAVTPSNFTSQSANTFLSAPNGSAGVPTFRTIVAADVPTLNQNTTGTAATVTTAAQPAITSVGTLTSLAVTNGITQNGGLSVGYLEMPQHATGTATLTLSDSGKHIYNTTATQTYTIPAATSVAYPIGTAITFVNTGAGTCSIAITTDTMYLLGTGTTGLRTLAAYGMATALKVSGLTSLGVWVISGVNLT
jgi:hypothetical protein